MALSRRTLLTSSVLLWAGLLAGCHQSTTHEFTILHFNDLHDRLLPDPDGIGGVAHMATLLKRERAAAHASITSSPASRTRAGNKAPMSGWRAAGIDMGRPPIRPAEVIGS